MIVFSKNVQKLPDDFTSNNKNQAKDISGFLDIKTVLSRVPVLGCLLSQLQNYKFLLYVDLIYARDVFTYLHVLHVFTYKAFLQCLRIFQKGW